MITSAIKSLATPICAFLLCSMAYAQTPNYQPQYQQPAPYQQQQPAYQQPQGQQPQGQQSQYTNRNQPRSPLSRGNFAIGSGVGYVNAVSSIQIDNGSNVYRGGTYAYQLHLTPSIGYFFGRNFVFGLAMDYLVNTSRGNKDANPDAPRTSDTKLLFGPYTRLYLPFSGDQAFFLGAVYGYGQSETEIAESGSAQIANTRLMTFGVGPGYTIFSNRRVALECQAKYNYGASRSTIQVENVDQTTTTETRAWDFVVGMHFYFSRRNN